MLVAPQTKVGVLLEAKVTSDCSSTVTFDVMRNQLARNIDVMLNTQPKLPGPLNLREPDRSAFVLLTPELFRVNWSSRLYGWLMRDYRGDPETLGRDPPHREGADWPSVARRIGWATFEDCRSIEATACAWLPTAAPGRRISPSR